MLLVPLRTGLEFLHVYRASAWLPWMLNTLVALYLFRQSGLKEPRRALT